MRRYSTAIVIAIAVVLAGIIVATSLRQVAADDLPADGSTAVPTDHRIAETNGRAGTVDVAAAARTIAALERARVANPGSVRIMLDLGDACVAARRYGDAERVYGDALAASPGHPDASVGLAVVWHANGDDDRAVRLLRRTLSSFPDHQPAHYELALVLFSQQEIAAARTAWVRASEIDPTSVLGRCSQGFVELLSGRGDAP